ncbi:c-type cytochrome [Legionella bononiensis]|uniref:C-type cytochrome n=1 Tax=Legionella bononiensis TaxID=2793102 RepID=A0ABS1WCI2_9GAMM|nr:c-type cytochrome [Legionella bononiensis]MBL7478941.1 c-type cytochrome [Legionella bononiensis]MBL7527073.1 c-type cytochrome [Legionella bononiensis]MBL7562042.1 c-type cytochrome [Legionella bononiensis]
MKRILGYILLSLISTMSFSNDLGKKTYDIACQNCHSPKLATAIKAPAAFDKNAWQIRFKKAKTESEKNPSYFKTPIDYLLYSVKMGKGLMHHGGLCNEADIPNKDCSDEALIAAINYMSEQQSE